MTANPVGVDAGTSALDTEALLASRGFSSVVVFDQGKPLGVVSRTDLLRAARDRAHHADGAQPLAPIPKLPVGELCRIAPITVSPNTTVSEAARMLVERRIHRVFVEAGGALVGVFSTKDLLAAIVAARVSTPVQDLMSQPLFTLPVEATLAQATDLLEEAHVSGVTVIDPDGWPVGYFSQAEALAARGAPANARVEDFMNCALVCLHERAELHRAAALAHAARARRVLIVHDKHAVGVLAPPRLARAVRG
ncbi:MAG: CBS domain-containing protein [Polyangiaceae bacterium]